MITKLNFKNQWIQGKVIQVTPIWGIHEDKGKYLIAHIPSGYCLLGIKFDTVSTARKMIEILPFHIRPYKTSYPESFQQIVLVNCLEEPEIKSFVEWLHSLRLVDVVTEDMLNGD